MDVGHDIQILYFLIIGQKKDIAISFVPAINGASISKTSSTFFMHPKKEHTQGYNNGDQL